MNTKAYYFTVGFMIAMLTATVIISQFPIPDTEQVCEECGMKAWYFKLAEGE